MKETYTERIQGFIIGFLRLRRSTRRDLERSSGRKPREKSSSPERFSKKGWRCERLDLGLGLGFREHDPPRRRQ